MDITPFNAPMTKGRPKVIKTREELDVAGRYFVCKLEVLRLQTVRDY
jgi:hypothetical protein